MRRNLQMRKRKLCWTNLLVVLFMLLITVMLLSLYLGDGLSSVKNALHPSADSGALQGGSQSPGTHSECDNCGNH